MTDLFTLGTTTRSKAEITPTQISEIATYISRRWSFVRVEFHLPLDTAVTRPERLNAATHARRALNGVPRLTDNDLDRYELWQFAKFTLRVLERDGWHFGIGQTDDGQTLVIVLTPAQHLPATVAVETPEPGETRETEVIRDFFGGQKALKEYRDVVRNAAG